MIDNPLKQFEIKTIIPFHIGEWDLSITNFSLFLMIVLCFIIILLLIVIKTQQSQKNCVPKRLFMIFNMAIDGFYELVHSYLKERTPLFFHYILSLFIFIFGCNILGLIPGFYTITSHILVTLVLALIIFLSSIMIGFYQHGLGFFKIFMPSNVPLVMAPLLIPVEILSFLSRPLSLGIRLCANMICGHVIMKLFSSFSTTLFENFNPLGVFPFIIHVGLFGFEAIVAFLQAYVFCILTCIYFKDSLEMHH
jgi:F-type H+-transporting ATPase subunit a